MAIPLVAGIAIAAGAGAAGGGIFGNLFGGSIDTERERLESLVSEYFTAANEIQEQYNFSSITDIINKDVLGKKKGIGIDDTYMTDLSMAFTTPEQFNFLAKNEDLEGVA